MNTIVTISLALLGALLGSLATLMVAGRRRLDAPRCAACQTAVTPRVWSRDSAAIPVCPCGAALDRPGAIATARAPAPRWVRRSLLLVACLATALLAADLALRAAGERWMRVVPTMALPEVHRLRNSSESHEARLELDRRLWAGEVSAAHANALLRLNLERSFGASSFHSSVDGLRYQLMRPAAGDPASLKEYLERTVTLTVYPAPDESTSSSGEVITLRMAAAGAYACIVRIDGVLVDGTPISWAIRPARREMRIAFVGPRVFTNAAVLDIPAGGSELRIECTVAVQPLLGKDLDVNDPLLNDPSLDVAAWRINAIPLTRTVVVPIRDASRGGGR